MRSELQSTRNRHANVWGLRGPGSWSSEHKCHLVGTGLIYSRNSEKMSVTRVGEGRMGKDRQERLGQMRGHDNEDGFYSKCSGKPTGAFRQVLQSLQSVDDTLISAYFHTSCRWEDCSLVSVWGLELSQSRPSFP